MDNGANFTANYANCYGIREIKLLAMLVQFIFIRRGSEPLSLISMRGNSDTGASNMTLTAT